MTSARPSSLGRFLHGLGSLGAREEAMAFSPDIRGARSLTVTSAAVSIGVIARFALGLGGVLPVVLGLVAFAVGLRFLGSDERPSAAVLLAVFLGLVWLSPIGPWVLLVPPVLALLALGYLGNHHRARRFDRALEELAGRLGEGWKIYLPEDKQAYHAARVLVSPEGQTFLLGVTPGRAEQRYGTAHVGWQDVTADTVRTLAARDTGVVEKGQRVLWVVKPPRTQGTYDTTAERGVTTVIGTPGELAGQLQDWSGMRRNLEEHVSPSDLGRAVEEAAAEELEGVLPAGWQMRRNVLLASGGDADLVLITPQGERYVVDVKARTDRMDLGTPRGERAKSWAEIHDQVLHAARQLSAVAVVWQPRTRDTGLARVGETWCVRGGAHDLLRALETL